GPPYRPRADSFPACSETSRCASRTTATEPPCTGWWGVRARVARSFGRRRVILKRSSGPCRTFARAPRQRGTRPNPCRESLETGFSRNPRRDTTSPPRCLDFAPAPPRPAPIVSTARTPSRGIDLDPRRARIVLLGAICVFVAQTWIFAGVLPVSHEE